MNFALVSDENGRVSMTLEKGDPLLNAMVLSVSISKGDWWKEPGFGLDRSRLRKDSADAPVRLKSALESASAWIVEAGLARHMDISVKRSGPGRINFTMTGYRPDGGEAAYSNFVEVI